MKKRILYIDILNIIACICVVAMHCNGIVHMFSNSRAWKTSLLVETLAYWAVPVFFMITGATLLDYTKKYSTRKYMKKRVEKTVIPFLVWSIFFLVVGIHTGTWKLSDLTPLKIVSMIFNSQVNVIYWFFPAMFTVYLGIPVFAHIKEESRNKILNYLIAYGLVMVSIVPCICTILGIPFNASFSPAVCGGYMLLVLIGYKLANTPLDKKARCMIYACGIAGWAIRFFSTLYGSMRIGDLDKTFWGYCNFPSVMLSIAVFVWFKYHDWSKLERNNRCQKVIGAISGCSFGIYLLHYLFIWQLPIKYGIHIDSWQWRILGTIGIYLVSLLIVYIIKKIPVVKKIVP